METGNYDYEVGDVVYLYYTVVTKEGTCNRQGTCPARYLGEFKDRFDMAGTTYCFTPIRSAKPYAIVRFKPEKVNGKTLSRVIPFGSKPRCYGKVKR